MLTMRGLLGLLVAAFIGAHSEGAICNQNLLKKIKKLNLNTDELLKSLTGKYMFSWITKGTLADRLKENNCIKFSFKRMDAHEPERFGLFSIGKSPDDDLPETTAHVVFHSKHVFALYICSHSDGEQNPPAAFIAQSLDAENVEEEVKNAKEAMTRLGFTEGVHLGKCDPSHDSNPDRVYPIMLDCYLGTSENYCR